MSMLRSKHDTHAANNLECSDDYFITFTKFIFLYNIKRIAGVLLETFSKSFALIGIGN